MTTLQYGRLVLTRFRLLFNKSIGGYLFFPPIFCKQNFFTHIFCYWVNFMFKLLILAIIIFFSVIGISEILHNIWINFFKTKTPKYQVVKLQEENAKSQVLYIMQEINWHGREFADKIFFLNGGLNEGLLAECRALCKDVDAIEFCNDKELLEHIKR